MAEPLGVICGDGTGWAAVRARWQKALPLEFENLRFFDVASQSDAGKSLKEAQAEGIRKILVAEVDIARLPRSEFEFFIYLDCTVFQAQWIHHHRPPALRQKSKVKKIRELARAGHKFLCTSRLAAHGVAEEYRANLDQIHIVPPPVETDSDTPTQSGEAPTPLMLEDQDNLRLESLRSCNLLVLGSNSESYPWAALEAMSRGKPVIARNIGAASEVIEDSINGFVIDRSDPGTIKTAIARYEREPELFRKHGDAAREKMLKENALSVHAQRIGAIIGREISRNPHP